LNRILRGALSTAAGFGKLTVAAGAAGLAFQSLFGLLAALSAALAEIAPAGALAVSGLTAVALAAGTVKLAMVGVSEAVEAAFDPETKPEELEKALKRLAPEARKFVTELRSMRGQLRQVQQSVQNRFFKDFDDTLRTLSRTTLPIVRRSLEDTADTLNEMARGAANAASDLATDGTLGRALDGATKGLDNLRRIPAQIVTGLGQIAAAAAPAFDKLTRRIDTAATKIADRLEKAFETGTLEKRIDAALSALGQLFDSIGNIGSGLQNIFAGLTQDGRGLFDVLEELTQAFEDLTASKEFQLILGELAKTADTLVKNLLPVLQEAFKQLAPVIAELAPVVREFIDEIGPELIPILEELGPILVDIAKIMREQLPLAIDLAKGAIDVLRVALEFLGFIINDVVLPISRMFRQLYENDLVRGIRAFINEVGRAGLEIARKLPQIGQAFSDVFSRISRILGEFSGFLRRNVVGAFAGFIADVASRIRALPGIIAQAFASLGRILYSSGLNAILGFISGFSSGIGRLLSIARGVADSISNTIRGALNIQSPSKVMAAIGEDTMEGLVVGMQRMLPEIERTVNGIAGTISPSFALPGGQSLGLSGISVGAPNVNVFIDGEQFTGRIRTEINANNRARDRVLSQGVRR
jgi:methyl-accepting chemotaxis protein